MKTKKIKKTAAPVLTDRTKSGTILLGGYRLGSHFLKDMCVWHARSQSLDVIDHPEFDWPDDDQSDLEIQKILEPMTLDNRYHVLIVNHEPFKVDMANAPEMLDRWHVIRLIDEDKHRWFKSWFFFLNRRAWKVEVDKIRAKKEVTAARLDGRPFLFQGDADSGHYYQATDLLYHSSWHKDSGSSVDPDLVGTVLQMETGLHHNTPKSVYEQMLERLPIELKFGDYAREVVNLLQNHVIGQTIPADEEITYQSMVDLANDEVPWLPNQYPDFDIEKTFDNGKVLTDLLDRWSGSWPGVFKEKR